MSVDLQGVQSAQDIKALMCAFIEKGFAFEYTYQKGGDSSCVYIYRFKKGRDFFDWRETSGAYEIHLVVSAGGEYRFPNPKNDFPKLARAFKLKHILKSATVQEKREFFSKLLLKKLEENPHEFYGICLA